MNVGEGVVLAAGLVKDGERFGIARQGTMGGLPDAAFDGFEGAIEPHADAVIGEQFAIGGKRESAAAQGEHRGASALDPADVLADDEALDTAEFGLPASGENLLYRGLLGGFDLRIGIEEVPTQAVRQVAAHRALARPHEADYVDSGRCCLSLRIMPFR